MNTPIVDFVKHYAESGVSRLHMPGHKGCGPLGVEQFDITEVSGADVLYSPDGVILESENNASKLFKTAHTYYSTEGSTLCIKAMLAIATSGNSKTVLAARNVHKAFLYGAALLDLKVEWLYPQSAGHICSCIVSAEDLENRLKEMSQLPSAVYVTSPDYLGNVQDIKALAKVCHSFDVPLLVDNAHGAYLGFLEESLHPIHLGADMCCDSAHKTLPVLTGGAYLHIGKNAPKGFCNNARRFLSLFSSTSPSYLIMQTLDLCNAELADGFRDKLSKTVDCVCELKAKLQAHGFSLLGDEPLKVTVDCAGVGLDGEQVAEKLRQNAVECEFCDRDVVVLMFSSNTDEEAFLRVKTALLSQAVLSTVDRVFPETVKHISKMSIREAMFAEQETVGIESSAGRICAAPNVACPPAVPPIISGEVVTAETVEILKYYNIEKIDVVK